MLRAPADSIKESFEIAMKARARITIVEQIAHLTDRKTVLKLGIMRAEIQRELIRHGVQTTTAHFVLTGERRAHYLARHKDVAAYEGDLLQVLRNPDAIHRNKRDTQMTIWYLQVDDEHCLRVAVWISNQKGRKNSVHSMRLSSVREAELGEEQGRLLWKK